MDRERLRRDSQEDQKTQEIAKDAVEAMFEARERLEKLKNNPNPYLHILQAPHRIVPGKRPSSRNPK